MLSDRIETPRELEEKYEEEEKSPQQPPPKETKPKPVKKTKRKKRSNLAIREDVMNKNFFRAFKREFKINFEIFINSSKTGSASSPNKDYSSYETAKTPSKKQCKFKHKLNEFSAHLLNQYGQEFLADPSFNKSEFNTYLGIFLNYCLMKKVIKSSKDRLKLESTNFIAYSYSHQKFYEFMRVPEVKALLIILFRMTTMEEFVKNHPALAAHESNYLTHTHRLCSLIKLDFDKDLMD